MRTRRRSLCPSSGMSARTGESIAVYSEARYVAASAYGNPVALTPEDRPARHSTGTSRRHGASPPSPARRATGSRSASTTLYHKSRQPRPGAGLNGQPMDHRGGPQLRRQHDVSENLGPASRIATGQTIHFPNRSFTTLRITIDGTTWSGRKSMLAASGVGFSEVRIPGMTSQRRSRCLRTSCGRSGTSSSRTASLW